MAFLLQGIALGLTIAAPVGPIGVLCIRRTLAGGRVSGLVTGLGAATADALYGTIAASGLTIISGALVNRGPCLRLVGGVFLCYLGIATFTAQPAYDSSTTVRHGVLKSYVSGLVLTLTNPMTILSFVAVFAGVGVAEIGIRAPAAQLLVLGTFLGSALWWLVLSASVSLLQAKLTERSLHWLNRVSGMVLIAFGVSSLCSALSGA